MPRNFFAGLEYDPDPDGRDPKRGLRPMYHDDLTRQSMSQQLGFIPTPRSLDTETLLAAQQARQDREDRVWVRRALWTVGAVVTVVLIWFVLAVGEPSLKSEDAKNAAVVSWEQTERMRR